MDTARFVILIHNCTESITIPGPPTMSRVLVHRVCLPARTCAYRYYPRLHRLSWLLMQPSLLQGQGDCSHFSSRGQYHFHLSQAGTE